MAVTSGQGWVQAWLDVQCKMISGIHAGVVVLGKAERGPYKAAAYWPAEERGSDELAATALQALEKRSAIVRSVSGSSDSESPTFFAQPIIISGRLFGVVAVAMDQGGDAQQKAALQLLHWGTAWLEVLVRQQASQTNQRLMDAMELVTECVEKDQFQTSATVVATELAQRLRCDRVSIGFVERGHTVVRVQSNTARVSTKTNSNVQIGQAMDEVLDQGSSVVVPMPETTKTRAHHAHEQLLASAEVGAVCSVPLVCRDEQIGAISLERSEKKLFSKKEVELCEYLGSVLGPILELQRREDRWLGSKVVDSVGGGLRKLLGPRHAGVKLITGCAVALIAFMGLATGDYRVTSRASLEGSIQRVVVASMEGFVASASARAGDVVGKGQLMATLDDKDLLLEQSQLEGQRAQLQREHRGALASHDRTESAIISAKLDQVSAQQELLQAQLSRARLTAPFEGVVVSGDLSQSIGSPVERGDVLFRVAPLSGYRVVLHVDERDISQLVEAQTGQLALAALPGEKYPFTIQKITPVAEVDNGYNQFRVEAKLQNVPDVLRPGMEGIGKIDIGSRKLLWIWGHSLVDWLRLWSWSWWP